MDRINKQIKKIEADIQEAFEKIPAFYERILTEEEIAKAEKLMLEGLDKKQGEDLEENRRIQKKVMDSLEKGNENAYNRLATYLACQYLIIRNKLPTVSVPRVGNVQPVDAEGASVKGSVRALSEINSQLSGEIKNEIEEKTLQKIVQEISNLFWYPKIDEKDLLKESDAEWHAVAHRFNRGAIPRDNDIRTLQSVTVVHWDTIFSCFSNFNREECRDKIIKIFVEKVSADWSLTSRETAEFVRKAIIVIHSSFDDAPRTPVRARARVADTPSSASSAGFTPDLQRRFDELSFFSDQDDEDYPGSPSIPPPPQINTRAGPQQSALKPRRAAPKLGKP